MYCLTRAFSEFGELLKITLFSLALKDLIYQANKMDSIIIGTSRQRSKLTHFLPTPILNHGITLSDNVHNLSVIFDRNYNFRNHISLACHSCVYHIRDLRRFRHNISLSVAKTIAMALITSMLDYCNFLLYNVGSKGILKLQYVQNCLSMDVTLSSRCSHSVPLFTLHFNLFTRSLFNIASSSNSVPLPIKLFLLENLRIFPCFL